MYPVDMNLLYSICLKNTLLKDSAITPESIFFLILNTYVTQVHFQSLMLIPLFLVVFFFFLQLINFLRGQLETFSIEKITCIYLVSLLCKDVKTQYTSSFEKHPLVLPSRIPMKSTRRKKKEKKYKR